MKQIAVVCNNENEWRYFVESLQWKCSKESTPYKYARNIFIDLMDNKEYHKIPNNYSMVEKLRGREWYDYILLCSESNVDLEVLNSYMRGK